MIRRIYVSPLSSKIFSLFFFGRDPESNPAIWEQDEENRAGGGAASGANYTTMTRKSRLPLVRASSLEISTYVRRVVD